MAIKALERANWNMEQALDGFFTNPPSPPPPERDALDDAKIIGLFDKYRDLNSSDQVIIWTGIEKLCKDLGVDPNDIVVMVFSYHCQCKTFSEISLEEWKHGSEELQFDSIQKLKDKLDSLRAELWDEVVFKNFYQWVFNYAKEGTARTLDTQGACELWKLIFADRFKYLDQWCKYLLEEKKLRVVSKDIWNIFLEFTKQIQNGPENYDANGALPDIFDDFVTYLTGGAAAADDEEDEDL